MSIVAGLIGLIRRIGLIKSMQYASFLGGVNRPKSAHLPTITLSSFSKFRFLFDILALPAKYHEIEIVKPPKRLCKAFLRLFCHKNSQNPMQNHAFRTAKRRVLRPNMQHFAYQYAAYCETKCMVLQSDFRQVKSQNIAIC